MVLVCLLANRGAVGKLYNDSYQYLSMAYNLQTHGEVATSIVEFDTERSRGRIPAPATTVAPGYSVAIRMLSWTQIAPEKTGLLISLLGMAGVVPLLWWSSGLVGATRNMRRAVILIWIINADMVNLATSVISEGLFTFLVLSGVALLLYCVKMGESGHQIALPIGMALIGLSYWVRYAGLLVVVGLVAYVAWRLIFRRERIMLWFVSLATGLFIVACGMVRNAVIAGTWRGGNDLVVHTPITKVLHDTASIGYHLFFGASPHVGIGTVISIASVLVIALLLRRNSGMMGPVWSDASVLLLLLVGGYAAAMMYAGMTTMIIFNYSTRYFLPMLPELLLLGVAVAAYVWPLQTDSARRRATIVLGAVALCGYAGQNIREMQRFDYRPEHLLIASYYMEPTQEGTALGDWVARNIPPESVIVATDGQASAYALHRPAISLVSPRMSHGKWDENQVRQTMAAFHARYLITYPGISDESASEQRESEFLHDLVQGEHPAWLVPAAHNSHVAIFEDTEVRQTEDQFSPPEQVSSN
jgi:hypothetical protein